MSCKLSHSRRQLIKEAGADGIFLKEADDTEYVYQITPDRHIRFLGSRAMSPENMEEMYRLADYGNMEYVTTSEIKKLALKPSIQHI